MRRHKNRNALMDALGLWAMSAVLIYLLLSGRSRELVAPRSEGLLWFSAVVFFLWGGMAFSHIRRWSRRIRYGFFWTVSLPAVLLILPHHAMTPNSFAAQSPSRSLFSSGGKGAESVARQDESFSIQEITSEEASRFLEEKRAEQEQPPREKEQTNSKDGLPIILPSGKKYVAHGYDAQNRRIDIADDEFYPWLNELFANTSSYMGYEVTMKAWVFWDEKMGEGQFLLSRYLISCCVADAIPAGILAGYSEKELPGNGNWVQIKGRVVETEFEGRTQPKLILEQLTPTEPPEEPYVYYYQY
ncbi:MAG: TIGR03943 family protein [Ndongobacter sp.]|nr:TIGR03943 family protein [Ndongobacter sp.]